MRRKIGLSRSSMARPLAGLAVVFRATAVAFALATGIVLGGCGGASSGSTTIQVWKTPTCGCCSKWIDHLEAAGFTVEATDLPDLSSVKREHAVPSTLESCHTALVGGYVLEGHVPAGDVVRLLAERPAEIKGLAVPEMPLGSPGMEHPDPTLHQPYEVMSFGQGGIQVFASHPAAP